MATVKNLIPIRRAPRLAIAAVKQFRGMDGSGLNADLYFDGKKVAFLLDEGCGGEMNEDWSDYMHGKSDSAIAVTAYIDALMLSPEVHLLSDGELDDDKIPDPNLYELTMAILCPKCHQPASVSKPASPEQIGEDWREHRAYHCFPCKRSLFIMEQDLAALVNETVDEYTESKRLKRLCQTKTVIRCADGAIYTVKAPFSEATKQRLLAKQKDIVEFINERFLGKAA